MSRRKKKRLARFIALAWELVDSEAWKRLSNASRVALVHLKRKVTNPNPGQICLSYNEMEKIMHRQTFARAIRQLEKFGFIVKEQMGGLYRRRNYFLLSEDWREYGQGLSAKNRTVDGAKNRTVRGQNEN